MRYFVLAVLPLMATAASLLGAEHPCWDRNNDLRQNAGPDGNLAPGGEYFKCDFSGGYGPKQCSGAECYCVDKTGAQIERYTRNRWEAQRMACNCAREESEIVGFGKTVKCDEFGDYHHTQILGSSCFCSDRVSGESTGTKKDITECQQLETQCAAERETSCWDKNDEFKQNAGPDGNLPPGGEYVKCDLSGGYKPKQCSGSQCYCVDKSGAQLKSYSRNRWEAQQMACNCAREESEIVGFGKRVKCDEFGDYHHTQILGSGCFCADKVSGNSTGTESHITDCQQLETKCAAERETLCRDKNDELRQNAGPDGNLPPGAEYLKCDLSGGYKPKQCSGSQCYCVDKSGAQLKSYSRNRWEAQRMACNCAREESEIVGIGKSVKCDDFGDYHHTQTLGSSCFCADKLSGESTGKESHITECQQLETQCAAERSERAAPGSEHPCWDKNDELRQNAGPDGNLPPGGEYFKCDLSGGYKPKQCKGSQCYCVDKTNAELQSYSPRNVWEAQQMACNCAREESEILGYGKTVTCDDAGDYHHTQQLGDGCFCADRVTGQKTGINSHITKCQQLEVACAADSTQ